MGSEVLPLTLALTMSPLPRPSPAQDPMRVRAERTGQSKRGALARRLHGNQGAGPFLRKLCLRDRPLWKRRRGCHFSKPEKKIVKAQNGIFFFFQKREKRTIPGFGWINDSALLHFRAPRNKGRRLFAPSRPAHAGGVGLARR